MKGKRCLITGAAGGLGRQIALKLSKVGCHLVLLGRDQNRLSDLRRELLGVNSTISIDIIAFDLLDPLELDKFLSKPLSVDILINCAGIFPLSNLLSATPSEFKNCLRLNVEIPFLLCQKFSPSMVRHGWGRIVNVGSSSSYNGSADRGIYCTSKHALLGFSRSLYLELKPHNVRVFTLSPGSLKTDMGATDTGQDFSTFINPAEVADYLIHALMFDSEMISEEIRLNRMTIQ